MDTLSHIRGCHGRDRVHMVIGFTITTKVVSSNPAHGEVYLIQDYVMKFVSDLRQVSGFLLFSSPIKLIATI